jgi:methylmalonyl-CoA mutase cobalamin-binding domain/chain
MKIEPSQTVDLTKLFDAILAGDAKSAAEVTVAALAENRDSQLLLTNYMIPAMDEVGRKFEANEYFVPELLISARAMKAALAILRPVLAESGVEPVGRVVIGTVKGDLHDIGKGLVASMMEGGGFEVIDLGVDVSPEKFVAEARAKGADIVALSALLTTTMTSMKSVINAIDQAGLRKRVKILIGGAPVTQRFAENIGADGYGPNANAAVALARRLLGT